MDINYSTVLSTFSLAISIFIAGWTVYKDAIRKPKFKVSINVKSIIQKDLPKIGPFTSVEAINMGPIENRIGLVFAKHGFLARKFLRKQSAFIYPDYSHMANTAKSQRIPVGDYVCFVFPINEDTF